MTAAELATALRRTLMEISGRLPVSRQAWDQNRTLQLAVMKLWIDAGNYAESYRKAIGVATRVQPWSQLVGYRGVLAHVLPEDFDPDLLWMGVNEAQDMLAAVNAATQDY